MSKSAIRRKVWSRLTSAGVARFPVLQSRIPNFAGAEPAARLLRQLTIWRRARTIKCDASPAQLWLRRAALDEGKTLYIVVGGLRAERCFLELAPARLGIHPWRAANLRRARALGRFLTKEELQPVDLVLTGCIAVNRQGAMLGPGGGTGDLEYALLRQAGKVREYTPIVTTVHPLQLLEERIPMRPHDVPVDFVISAENVIAAPNLFPRPRGILWDLLSDERIRTLPSLRRARGDSQRGKLTPGGRR
jgi:5-formyltetrahydrofolate cyclo-ligase